LGSSLLLITDMMADQILYAELLDHLLWKNFLPLLTSSHFGLVTVDDCGTQLHNWQVVLERYRKFT